MSIQVSLDGLSFCVLDTIAKRVVNAHSLNFKTESTPYLLLKELKKVFDDHNLGKEKYEEVTIVHKNDLFCLVPKSLFDKNELPNYLKFNTKLLANDEIVYDVLPSHDLVCVYVPFTNINNYVFDDFGEFEFKHHSMVILQTLFHQKNKRKVCYVHVSKSAMEITVLEQKKLLLYNQFSYKTPEDFIYYVLFTYEQLKLNVEEVKLKLFGDIEEGDPIFDICYQYIKKVNISVPKYGHDNLTDMDSSTIDLTLLNN